MGSILNDAQAHILVEGDSFVLLQKIAKDTLKRWKKMSILGYFNKIIEIIFSPWHIRPFLIKEIKLVIQLAFYLPKKNIIDAWIKIYEPLVYELAWARVNNVILKKYKNPNDIYCKIYCKLKNK